MSTLTLIRGDDQDITLTFTDSAGAALDLTGSIVYFTAKKPGYLVPNDDNLAVIKKDIFAHSDPVGGITILTLTGDDTDIEAGNYQWDLQVKNTSSKISSTVKGSLVIMEDVTKRIT